MEQHIDDLIEDKARKGSGEFAIAYALLEVTAQLKRISSQLDGIADATGEGLRMMASATGDIGVHITNAFEK